jgi:hypothetical protein
MKLRPERDPEPLYPLLSRFAAMSAPLRALSDWLDTRSEQPAEAAATGGEIFTAEQQSEAEKRDRADRFALAGRDLIAREPEPFELFGRSGLESWRRDVLHSGRYVRSAHSNADEPADNAAYVVIVARLDRAGRKLVKLLIPRFRSNGPIPIDEASVPGWAMIPPVEWWGTRCDSQPARETNTAGDRLRDVPMPDVEG